MVLEFMALRWEASFGSGPLGGGEGTGPSGGPPVRILGVVYVMFTFIRFSVDTDLFKKKHFTTLLL